MVTLTWKTFFFPDASLSHLTQFASWRASARKESGHPQQLKRSSSCAYPKLVIYWPIPFPSSVIDSHGGLVPIARPLSPKSFSVGFMRFATTSLSIPVPGCQEDHLLRWQGSSLPRITSSFRLQTLELAFLAHSRQLRLGSHFHGSDKLSMPWSGSMLLAVWANELATVCRRSSLHYWASIHRSSSGQETARWRWCRPRRDGIAATLIMSQFLGAR